MRQAFQLAIALAFPLHYPQALSPVRAALNTVNLVVMEVEWSLGRHHLVMPIVVLTATAGSAPLGQTTVGQDTRYAAVVCSNDM